MFIAVSAVALPWLVQRRRHSSGAGLSAPRAVRFAHTVGLLKRQKRTGWVLRGVPLPESVADHSYRMAMLAMICSVPGVDSGRAVQIALVHDLAEAHVTLQPRSRRTPPACAIRNASRIGHQHAAGVPRSRA